MSDTQNKALADDALYRDIPGGGAVGAVQHGTIDVPLATIQAQASGVAFNIGPVLAPNTRLMRAEIDKIQLVAGGNLNAASAEVGSATDTPQDSIVGPTNVFTGAGLGFVTTPGSDPYQSRGGQQLQMTLTVAGDTLNHATAGHLAVSYYFVIEP